MKYKMRKLIILLLISFQSLAQESFELVNKVYDPYIKTVQLYPLAISSNAQLLSAAIPLRGNQNLVLEFDELFNDAFTYQVKYIRCDANWKKSTLSDLEFLTTYNEFTINEYEYSFNTKTPYVHYKKVLPKPKLSGNYVLIVYADGDESDVIISHRFILFENKVTFSDQYGFTGFNQASRFNQQLQFEINYKGVVMQSPRNQVSVSIIQNQRWDNMRQNLKPTFVREGDYKLEYRYFTEETMFAGGNEFRFFDLRSIKYFGEHVKTARYEKDKIYTFIEDDKPRGELAYTTELMDLNGKFVIDNVEGYNPLIENDYSKVEFTLHSPKVNGKVYIGGALTDWARNKENTLTYYPESEVYIGSLILKQGWYNYQYLVESRSLPLNYFEGNWSATNNQYQIIVYYRPYDLATDLIIGYLDLGAAQP
jgi:type 9 secretion system plug protein